MTDQDADLRRRAFGQVATLFGNDLARFYQDHPRLLFWVLAALLILFVTVATVLSVPPSRAYLVSEVKKIVERPGSNDTEPTATLLPTITPSPTVVVSVPTQPPEPTLDEIQEPSAWLTQPVDGAVVPEISLFRGEYSALPERDCLWALIDNPWNDKLFRQGPLWTKNDGDFDRRISIGSGRQDDQNKEFVVNVAWVPWLTCVDWKNEKLFFGYLKQIDTLPVGVELLSSISVILDQSLDLE